MASIINFSPEPPLKTELRDYASGRLHSICEHFDTGLPQGDFSRPRLIRYTYTYSLSQESGDYFLRAFFQAVDLRIDGDELVNFENIRSKFFDFGDYLFDNFFLPVKASTKKTPQPSPASHSAGQEAQGGQQYVGTGSRLSDLRRDCLIRDRHRCVISRKFDLAEAQRRHNPDGARDDDGNLLRNDSNGYPEFLEVAHILPHSLTKVNQGGELVCTFSSDGFFAILNMLDVGVAELIQGHEIDRPRNALTLTMNHHRIFGDFKVYFEPVPSKNHTYTIKTFDDGFLAQGAGFPVTRELYLTPKRTIEPPSPRLLALHRAIALILHRSAAGDYIEKIYRDLEEQGVQADGSTPLGRFVSLAISEQSSSVCT